MSRVRSQFGQFLPDLPQPKHRLEGLGGKDPQLHPKDMSSPIYATDAFRESRSSAPTAGIWGFGFGVEGL